MYCGSNKIALASQRQIADTLSALMQELPFREISISRICQASGISRQTFYSLFSSKENVIVFQLKSLSCQAEAADEDCSEDACEEEGLPNLCARYSRFICENAELFRLLQENGILYLLYDSIYETFSCCSCCHASSSADRIYRAHFLAGSITGIVRAYIENGCSEGSDELLSHILNLFNGSCME